MSPLVVLGFYAVVLFVAMYLMVYVPNKKKHRKMQELHNALKPGDRVITIGGICGVIAEKEEDYAILIIDEEKDVRLKVVLYAINQVVTSA